jgi:peptidoglycan-N-acetylglucosamine deacetylase
MVHRTPFFLPWLYPPSLLWRIETSEKVVYLTFDDGPVDGPTQFVLDELEKYNAKATFFCIGDNIQKHPDVFQNIINAGHRIGNHTFNHMNGWRSNPSTYRENITLCDGQISKFATANYSKLFRPPYGRISRSQIRDLSDYKIIMWDVLSVDYNKNLSPHSCLRNTIRATRPGSIIVFHDSYKAEKNLVYALPRFLEHFSEKGFRFNLLP